MRQLIRRPSRACLPFVVVALMAPAATIRAETPAPGPAPRSVMYETAQVAARPAAPAPAPASQQSAAAEAVRAEAHVGAGKNAALMVVGAAAIVTGALVGGGGGTAIAIGGAALGLYGLYHFVK